MAQFIQDSKLFQPAERVSLHQLNLLKILKSLGFPVGRLKTGTPPRIDGRTIDWDAFEVQNRDENPVAFSFSTEKIEQSQINCHIGYTNEKVHQ